MHKQATVEPVNPSGPNTVARPLQKYSRCIAFANCGIRFLFRVFQFHDPLLEAGLSWLSFYTEFKAWQYKRPHCSPWMPLDCFIYLLKILLSHFSLSQWGFADGVPPLRVSEGGLVGLQWSSLIQDPCHLIHVTCLLSHCYCKFLKIDSLLLAS